MYVSYQEHYFVYAVDKPHTARGSMPGICLDWEGSNLNQDAHRVCVICWAVGGCITGP